MTAQSDWSTDAFFDEPETRSVDGGTTSSGHLWHEVTSRWGHSMHSMCSYYGMFPAKVAHYFIQRHTDPGDLVVDPFSGRGTTVLQARVTGRRAIANDLNPLAFVLSRAKAAAPAWEALLAHIDAVEADYRAAEYRDLDVSPDIKMLYHDNTLRQLVYVRELLLAKSVRHWSSLDAMLAGSLAGIMHGGWRRDGTSQYLSISMPNTFSMAPTYVAKYIRDNGLQKIDQDVFERLREKVARQYLDDITGFEGRAFHQDAKGLMSGRRLREESVDLVLTSPPYLQVVNYGASNWIRLWLLGVDEVSRDQGAGRKSLDAALDHRHTYSSYAAFILKTLEGAQRVIKPDGAIVLVIGDVAEPGKTPLPLAAKVWDDIRASTNLQLLDLIEDDLPATHKVSRIWGDSKGQATNRDCALVLARKDGEPRVDRAIDWDEPYKDAGPDAAHELVRAARIAI